MKRFAVSTFAIALSLTLFSLTGCKKDPDADPTQTGEFTLHLDNGVTMANASGPANFNSLVLDATTYKNANGDDFTVSAFRYYLSNIKLLKADNSSYTVPDSYFLVDQANPESQDLTMQNVPVGDYTGISFVVGVDSARTKAGNFKGALDPNNGMLWTMNGDEFINLKLEGRSPQSPSKGLIFHLAGYKHSTTNTIRTVSPSFSGTTMLVRPDHFPEIHMHVDIAKLFNGPNPATATPAPFQNPVNFATVYNQMSGPPVAKLADNVAAGMFSVAHIHAN
jgi:hypothetical protein